MCISTQSKQSPTRIWNEGMLHDMLLKMEGHHPHQKDLDDIFAKIMLPNYQMHRLQLFMENRLEIALALLETLEALHHND